MRNVSEIFRVVCTKTNFNRFEINLADLSGYVIGCREMCMLLLATICALSLQLVQWSELDCIAAQQNACIYWFGFFCKERLFRAFILAENHNVQAWSWINRGSAVTFIHMPELIQQTMWCWGISNYLLCIAVMNQRQIQYTTPPTACQQW